MLSRPGANWAKHPLQWVLYPTTKAIFEKKSVFSETDSSVNPYQGQVCIKEQLARPDMSKHFDDVTIKGLRMSQGI